MCFKQEKKELEKALPLLRRMMTRVNQEKGVPRSITEVGRRQARRRGLLVELDPR
jgi:hypothetical protein